MLNLLEISAAAVALLLLFLTAAMALRSLMIFGKTAGSFQERAQPHVLELSLKSDIAQERALNIAGKADLLQRKLYRLLVTMRKMWVLISAIREVVRKVTRITSYIGL